MVRTVRAARCYHAADWQLSRLSNSWGKNVERHGTENILTKRQKSTSQYSQAVKCAYAANSVRDIPKHDDSGGAGDQWIWWARTGKLAE